MSRLLLYQVLIDEYNSQGFQPVIDRKSYDDEFQTLYHGEDYSYITDLDEREKRINSILVAKIYEFLHGQASQNGVQRTALCFSGGGIRSATFGLGVLQGLARHGLLKSFDFLSTVSGGGYLGSWFSAWIHHEQQRLEFRKLPATADDALNKVVNYLSAPPQSPLLPEPEPIQHLRSYSNYMSPKLGFLSADTWTLVAIFFRNILLNWLVLIPLILGVLAIPRICMAIATWEEPSRWATDALPLKLLLGFSIFFGIIAVAYIIANRPSLFDPPTIRLSRFPEKLKSEGWFLILCLSTFLLSSILITTYWAWLRIPIDNLGFIVFGYTVPSNLLAFIVFGIICHLGGFIVSLLIVRPSLGSLGEFAISILVGAIGGLLVWVVATYVFPNPVAISPQPDDPTRAALYICFALPLFLLVFLLAATMFVGIASWLTSDADREWLARAGAWFLIAILGWSVVSSIVIFGPVGLLYFSPKVQALLVALGSGSGLVTLLGGGSSESPANKKEENQQGSKSLVMKIALSLAAPVFTVFLLIVLSLGMSWLVSASATALSGSHNSIARWLTHLFSLDKAQWAQMPFDYQNLLSIIYYSPGWYLLALTVLIVGIGLLMGFTVNINKFSLHASYRDRLIRAYLGASRRKDRRRPNLFTGFDEHDNLPMRHLLQKPLHVINITLNLVAGKNLAWQDRKAESFTVSPLHAGSYCLGYRKSAEYAVNASTKRSISLGTAMAISGAAASPNMGYYSSPAVGFLMTIFNVRLGWWLGNPGKAGEDTYSNAGPTFAPKPLVAEALGWTNDEHPYVYLTDGGHFENLGLYEMILRRCHLIVLSDGSGDPNFTFDDLGNAISKIRVDLGVPIVFDEIPIKSRHDTEAQIYSRQKNAGDKYCAIGRICYSCVDANGVDGVLIYIKPAFYGTESADIFNYAKAHPTFPHESTGDQMYSESQFESYRELGSYAINEICKGMPVPPPDRQVFVNRILYYLGLEPSPGGLPKCNKR
ncbi:MAG TPA: patatin-like phospholipase family protein [Pyrinomonadaceae bacterium]|jgi:hypothetical protein